MKRGSGLHLQADLEWRKQDASVFNDQPLSFLLIQNLPATTCHLIFMVCGSLAGCCCTSDGTSSSFHFLCESNGKCQRWCELSSIQRCGIEKNLQDFYIRIGFFFSYIFTFPHVPCYCLKFDPSSKPSIFNNGFLLNSWSNFVNLSYYLK